MFDIGWQELLLVAFVLIIVVGPKDLPPMLRAFGRTTKKLRAMANEFRGQFDDALREAELDDVKKTFDDARKLNPIQSIRDAVNPLKDTAKDIRADLEKSMKTPASTTEPAPKIAVPEATMKLADGPPEFKAPEPAAAAAGVSGKAAPSGKPAETAKKPAAKPAVAKSAKAPAPAKPAAAKTAAKPKTAAAKPVAKAAAPAGKAKTAAPAAKAPAKPASAKSAPRAKKTKQGEGQA
jgi:sec-independent protein translocase protein TatB